MIENHLTIFFIVGLKKCLMNKKRLVILAGFLFPLLGLNAQPSTAPSFITDSLDNYIMQGMKDWNIPGLAVAIVKEGKVVMMKGYGIRDVKTNEPVDENTLFMIASNSKLFTATAIAQLENDNKLSIDDKVNKYVKDYTLYDKNTTELVTLRDLLSHRIGTKTFQGDFVFWNGNLSRAQIINKMKLLKPVGNFRQNFGYCNSCFLTAAEAIPAVSGKPWEVYVYDSILMPLGMNNTHTLTQGIEQRKNASKPYTTVLTGNLTELPYDHVDNLAPAGSIVSNVKDLSKWLLMQLDSGRLDGKRIIAWEALRKTRDMNITISSRKSNTFPTHYSGYGLGVFMNDYGGKQVYWHTGGAFGFVSNTCFVPEEKLGIVVLTNNDNQNFFEALRYQVLDAYLGVPYTNRSKAQLPAFHKEEATKIKKTASYQARVKGNAAGMLLDNSAGTYNNEIYGNIQISKDKKGKSLNIDFKGHNTLKAKLEYMDNDEWLLTYNNLGYGIFPVKFNTEKGKVVSIDIRVTDFLDYNSYTFKKVE